MRNFAQQIPALFQSKNLSPKTLSAFTAFLIALPISIGLVALHVSPRAGIIWFAAIFAGCYLLILFTLQTFIYRKLKLIYKLIFNTKATKREQFYYDNILPKKSIDNVREDVEHWAAQKTREIEMLKQSETFRKEFLQNISHELKTPLFAIQGYIDTLLSGAMHNPDVNEKFLSSASRNVERLVSLVQDLDEITRLETGTLLLNPKRFIIQDLFKEVFETLGIKKEQKAIKLVIKKGCESPVAVVADREKIRQVLNNLVDNAIKYGRQHGTVEASVYTVDGDTVLIEISDDGYGIPEESLPRVFERFYRTDAARSRGVGGSGLGLSISKHIIERHEQHIHVRSKLDVGTTFGFTLQRG